MSKWFIYKLYGLDFVTKFSVVDGYKSLEAICSLCFQMGSTITLTMEAASFSEEFITTLDYTMS